MRLSGEPVEWVDAKWIDDRECRQASGAFRKVTIWLVAEDPGDRDIEASFDQEIRTARRRNWTLSEKARQDQTTHLELC